MIIAVCLGATVVHRQRGRLSRAAQESGHLDMLQ
jgi:hypothetical protein